MENENTTKLLKKIYGGRHKKYYAKIVKEHQRMGKELVPDPAQARDIVANN